MRTSRKIENGDFEMLYFLNLFGLKYILNNEFKYAEYMKEKLESEGLDSEEVGASQSMKMKYQ